MWLQAAIGICIDVPTFLDPIVLGDTLPRTSRTVYADARSSMPMPARGCMQPHPLAYITQLFSVAEATILSHKHPGPAGHTWPKPTILSHNHPWTRGSRVPKPTLMSQPSSLERGDPSGRSPQLGSRYLPWSTAHEWSKLVAVCSCSHQYRCSQLVWLGNESPRKVEQPQASA